MTPDQLMAIVPGLKADKAKVIIDALTPVLEQLPLKDGAFLKTEINTPIRQAHFLAQLAHESDGFKASEEYASGKEYEGRKDLGNLHPGDGRRYKGRGWMEITGEFNYVAFRKDTGIDIVDDPNDPADDNDPKRASTPENSAKIAVWYWAKHGLNKYADADDIETITRRINGALNGLPSRQAYLERAYIAFGIETEEV